MSILSSATFAFFPLFYSYIYLLCYFVIFCSFFFAESLGLGVRFVYLNTAFLSKILDFIITMIFCAEQTFPYRKWDLWEVLQCLLPQIWVLLFALSEILHTLPFFLWCQGFHRRSRKKRFCSNMPSESSRVVTISQIQFFFHNLWTLISPWRIDCLVKFSFTHRYTGESK